jgi:hypothetical protein
MTVPWEQVVSGVRKPLCHPQPSHIALSAGPVQLAFMMTTACQFLLLPGHVTAAASHVEGDTGLLHVVQGDTVLVLWVSCDHRHPALFRCMYAV